MVKSYRNHSSTSKSPKHMFEKERIDSEVKVAGEYGLKNKKEIWRTLLALSKLRKRARDLLTLEENDERRIFEGQALMKRVFKYGLLNKEKENALDYVLAITLHKMLERRLQTKVFKLKLATSIHHARVLIKGKHIAVNGRVVNVPSYMVTVDNENKITLQNRSALNGGKPGRRLRKKNKA